AKIKEFAYFGFVITLISASIAHFSTRALVRQVAGAVRRGHARARREDIPAGAARLRGGPYAPGRPALCRSAFGQRTRRDLLGESPGPPAPAGLPRVRARVCPSGGSATTAGVTPKGAP